MSIPGYPEWTAGEMSPVELDRVDRLASASRRPYFDGSEEFFTGEGGTVARLGGRLACWARLTATDGSGIYSWIQVFREEGVWDEVEGGLEGDHGDANPARPVNDNGASFFADQDDGDIVWMKIDEDGLSWSFECCRDMRVVTKTTSYTVVPADDKTFFEADATSGSMSFYLPASADITPGFMIWVRRKDATSAGIGIIANGSDTLDTFTGTRVNPQYATFQVVWLGNEWSIISQSFPSTRVPGTLLVQDNFNWEPLLPGSDGKVLFAASGEALGVKWDNITFPAPVIVVQSQTGAPSYTGIGILQVNYDGSGVLTNGLSISNPSTGVAQINLDLASASGGGAVSTDAQTFAGIKTFSSSIFADAGIRIFNDSGNNSRSSLGEVTVSGVHVARWDQSNTAGTNFTGIEQDYTNDAITFVTNQNSTGPTIKLRNTGGTLTGQSGTIAGATFTSGIWTSGSFTGGANGTFSSGSF